MDDSLLESLLYQAESATLDFKAQQYTFAKGTPEQKGEILKDILAFANAWRQSDAHILIGVKEVKGGHSTVASALTKNGPALFTKPDPATRLRRG